MVEKSNGIVTTEGGQQKGAIRSVQGRKQGPKIHGVFGGEVKIRRVENQIWMQKAYRDERRKSFQPIWTPELKKTRAQGDGVGENLSTGFPDQT